VIKIKLGGYVDETGKIMNKQELDEHIVMLQENLAIAVEALEGDVMEKAELEKKVFQKILDAFSEEGLFNSSDLPVYVTYSNNELEIYEWLKANQKEILK
jgi:hypothetical protein